VASELASQSAKRDLQMPHVLAFAPDQVWAGLERNGLAMELSNSFLIVAQPEAQEAASGPVGLAWHYSVERRAEWCKLTAFEATDHAIQVRHRRLTQTEIGRVSHSGLHNQLKLNQTTPYVRGHSMAALINKTLSHGPWKLAALADALQPYLEFIHTCCGMAKDSAFDPNQEVSGEWFDALPQNIVLDELGKPHLIDDEWRTDSPITLGFLLFRAVQACAHNITRVAPCSDRQVRTPADLIEAAFVALGTTLSPTALRSCVEQEVLIQANIGGDVLDPEKRLVFLKNHQIAQHHLSDGFQKLSEQVLVQQAVITDRDNTVRIITGSRWWRLGAPVRWVMRRLKTS
jgi:hypothetical protein